MHDANHNLLFGIIALQVNFIDRHALVAAFDRWRSEKSRPLGAILVEMGALDADGRQLLDSLVAKHLRLHEGQAEKSLAAVASTDPVHEELKRVPDQDLARSLGYVAAHTIGHDAAATRYIPEDEGAAAGSRFRVLRPLAKGGLGEVHVAQDLEVPREVALKEIQSRYADEPSNRARFMLEAEITGGLEHPGIVPVYGIGKHVDGRPYYAMRFVRGESLHEAIRAFHAPAPPGAAVDPGEKSLELRRLLGRLVDVCDAIEYAHSRGVLHRDLKPSNIMLGKYGETLVVDWGLAKAAGADRAPVEQAEPALTPSSGGDSAPTQMGRAIGTPQYMSPEAAEGRLDLLSPATDVYGLGATLYCLLTGKAPFPQENADTVLSKVGTGDFAPPRQARKEVPPALEAICLKAMARRPSQRYRSAREMANDIEHWLADERVSAYPEPVAHSALRWARRRRGLVGGVAAALVALVVTGIAALVIGRRANERTLALAKAEALLDASAADAGRLLDELAPYREITRPSFVAAFEESEEGSHRKLHASLALAKDDPDQVDYLAHRLLTAGPEEFALIQAKAPPFGAELNDVFWRVVEDKKSERRERFRAACALIPSSWRDDRFAAIAPFVATELANSNSVELGPWLEVVRPAAARVAAPLGALARDPTRSELVRSLALDAFADFALSDEGALVDLLQEADQRQFTRLFPLLEKVRPESIARIEALLKTRLAPSWSDPALDPSWIPVPADIVTRIEAAQGLVEERFAFCQDMPLEEFDALHEVLRRSGYRPIRFRPFVSRAKAAGEALERKPDEGPAKNSIFVAAIWRRDGRDVRVVHGQTAESLLAQDAKERESGFLPTDVASYPAEGGTRHYAAIWTPRESDKDDGRLFLARTAPDAGEIANLLADGFRFVAMNEGGAVNGDPSFDVALRKGEPIVRSGIGLSGVEYLNYQREGALEFDISLRGRAPQDDSAAPKLRQNLTKADEILKERPHLEDALLERARARSGLRMDVFAIQDFDRYLSANDDANIRAERALCLARQGEREKALADVARHTARCPHPQHVAYVEASVNAWLGDDSALANLREELKSHEHDANWLYFAASATSVASEAFAKMDPEKARLLGDEADQLLDRSISAGRTDFDFMMADPDLDAIRDRPVFRRIHEQMGTDLSLSALWKVDTEFESTSLRGGPPAEQMAKIRELVAAGYRPEGISVVRELAPGTPVAGAGGETRVESKDWLTASVWRRPLVRDADRETLAKRQANAAIALARRGQADLLWPLLRHSPDPRVRSYLVDRLASFGFDPKLIFERLVIEEDVTIRRALALVLGGTDETMTPPDLRRSWEGALVELYRNSPDAGLHAAIQWLLRQWGQAERVQKIDQELATGQISPDRDWYVSGMGQTFAVFRDPPDFVMGSPITETGRWEGPRGISESRHTRRLGRSFALATQEVTVEQFLKFRQDHNYARDYAIDPQNPVNNVSWYTALAYCNWLSKIEGIPPEEWCYPTAGSIAAGMSFSDGHLKYKGYRLPTEAEWEFACRAGASTARFYGETEELLERYAWVRSNSKGRHLLRVGSLKPNDFGLFDTQGNVTEWTESPFTYFRGTRMTAWLDDPPVLGEIRDEDYREIRGGHFENDAPYVRSSQRNGDQPTTWGYHIGLRPARTID